jgi:putative thiamine transport system permease protein
MLALAPIITIMLVAAPILAGLAFTILPAFGIMPSIGRTQPSLAEWGAVLANPGFATASRLTLLSGLGATLMSFGLAVAFCAEASTRPGWGWLRGLQSPILASPHSAVALGLAVLVAPSGWLVRLLSPWMTGWSSPPADLTTPRDAWGLVLTLGLIFKETPYLVLMILGAASQIPVRALLAAGQALGQRPVAAWLKLVFPLIYQQIRLPVFAVLAFSLSVVDAALILAPSNPPPLGVLAVRWLTSYDLALYGPGCAAALALLLIIVAVAALWSAAETPVAGLARAWTLRGGPTPVVETLVWSGARLGVGLGLAAYGGLAGLALWSVARAWRFPDALPSDVDLASWRAQAHHALAAAGTTAAIGVAVVGTAVTLALACLEHLRQRSERSGRRVEWLVFAPLLLPQVAFLFGVQVVLIRIHLDGTLAAVAWSHLVFVLPYVLLSLKDPYLALDPRYGAAASALGAGPWRVFLGVTLPLLMRPILVASAVGFSVSLSLYLPTLFAGAGRIATVTTEAVALSSGGDRRIIGVFAMLQTILPLAAYALALAGPRLAFRRRRAMRA